MCIRDRWNTLRVPFTEEMGTTGDGRLTLVGKGSLSNKHELSSVSYTHLDVYKRQPIYLASREAFSATPIECLLVKEDL